MSIEEKNTHNLSILEASSGRGSVHKVTFEFQGLNSRDTFAVQLKDLLEKHGVKAKLELTSNYNKVIEVE